MEDEIIIKDIINLLPEAQNIIKKLVRLNILELDSNGNFNPNGYIISPLAPNPNLKNYIQK